MKKRIAILGSTGSIGRQTLEVIDRFPDKFEVSALAAGANVDELVRQALKYKPKIVSIGRPEDVKRIKPLVPKGTAVSFGIEGMIEAVVSEEVDVVVTSVTGTLGLLPTVEAIKAGKDIALANKETLVAAGELVMSLIREKGVDILPVDSEHSAIFQSLNGEKRSNVNKLILTASGGPFRNNSPEELINITPEDALRHPNWSMGKKITIDSATLMNKGLEVIEARWLFGIGFQNIDVVIHPQSIIHSMVEFMDGSVIGQMGLPDMRLPIQYALSYPDRWENGFPKLDFLQFGTLTFESPRTDAFPALALAYEAGNLGGTMPAVMNAANEIAVEMFLSGHIGFNKIVELIEKVMGNHTLIINPDLTGILESDRWAREETKRLSGIKLWEGAV